MGTWFSKTTCHKAARKLGLKTCKVTVSLDVFSILRSVGRDRRKLDFGGQKST